MMGAAAMSPYPRLSYLLAGLAHVPSEQDMSIHGLTLDSRHVGVGDMFIACAGYKSHGMQYAEQAIDAGAQLIVCEPGADMLLSESLPVPVFTVPQLSQHVGDIASRFYGKPSHELVVVAVTGTNGKTSCSQFIAQALNEDNPSGVIGTLGTGLYGQLQSGSHTTPDAISVHAKMAQMRDLGARSVVMEVSSHGLEQGRVNGVDFDVAVFTNLSRDHLDYHGDMQSYGAAKLKLFNWPGLRYAVLNVDDPFSAQIRSVLSPTTKIISYGFLVENNSDEHYLQAGGLKQNKMGLSFHIRSDLGEIEFQTALLGKFNVHNLLASLGALLSLGMPIHEAVERLKKSRTVDGRMEYLEPAKSLPMLVVDYAHTPDALEKALVALRAHLEGEVKTAGRLWCVFGCGGDRDQGKRAEMGAIAEQFADQVIVTDDNPRFEDAQSIIEDILQGIKRPSAVQIIRQREAAIAHAINAANPNDAVLIAGKGHEMYQIVGAKRSLYAGDAQIARQLLMRLLEGKA